MQITERDRKILTLCYEQEFLELGHVTKYFFRGERTNAARRIRVMTEAKLLKKEQLPSFGRRSFYRVSTQGTVVAREGSPHFVNPKRLLQYLPIDHHSWVTEVRLTLLKYWAGTWIPESALKHGEFAQIPDGVIAFPSGKMIAVELENSVKSKARYLDIFRKWKGSGFTLVLYVTTHSTRFTAIKKLLNEAPKDVAFGLVDAHALTVGKPKIWTPRGEVDLLSRKEF